MLSTLDISLVSVSLETVFLASRGHLNVREPQHSSSGSNRLDDSSSRHSSHVPSHGPSTTSHDSADSISSSRYATAAAATYAALAAAATRQHQQPTAYCRRSRYHRVVRFHSICKKIVPETWAATTYELTLTPVSYQVLVLLLCSGK